MVIVVFFSSVPLLRIKCSSIKHCPVKSQEFVDHFGKLLPNIKNTTITIFTVLGIRSRTGSTRSVTFSTNRIGYWRSGLAYITTSACIMLYKHVPKGGYWNLESKKWSAHSKQSVSSGPVHPPQVFLHDPQTESSVLVPEVSTKDWMHVL